MNCYCGCGNQLEPTDKYGRPHKFIHGHNRKGIISPKEEYDNRRGELSSLWKHGKYKKWYRKVLGVRQHRYIMEQYIGRKLLPNEDVHHINGDKEDNRIENLQIIDHNEHARFHTTNRWKNEKTKST